MATFSLEINGIIATNTKRDYAFYAMFDPVQLDVVTDANDLMSDAPGQPGFDRWNKPAHLAAISTAFGSKYCRQHSRLIIDGQCDLCVGFQSTLPVKGATPARRGY